ATGRAAPRIDSAALESTSHVIDVAPLRDASAIADVGFESELNAVDAASRAVGPPRPVAPNFVDFAPAALPAHIAALPRSDEPSAEGAEASVLVEAPSVEPALRRAMIDDGAAPGAPALLQLDAST